MKSFEWTEAATVADALTQIGGGAVAKAGGLDLLDRMKEGIDSPSRLVNIRNVRELRGVRQGRDGVSVARASDDARASWTRTR